MTATSRSAGTTSPFQIPPPESSVGSRPPGPSARAANSSADEGSTGRSAGRRTAGTHHGAFTTAATARTVSARPARRAALRPARAAATTAGPVATTAALPPPAAAAASVSTTPAVHDAHAAAAPRVPPAGAVSGRRAAATAHGRAA
jgi:hypothetical protein